MADLAATAELIDWAVKGVTILLMIAACSVAIKKKNNPAFFVALFGNLLLYLFTQSPLLCMIISISCIVWAGSKKEAAVSAPATAPANQPPKQKAEEAEEETKEKKIRCRFCKKLYSAEYNGCPYCKKK